MTAGHHLVFRVGLHRYLLHASLVRETIALPYLSAPHEAPAYVIGAFDFYGVVVPVIDLAARLGLPPTPAGIDSPVVLFTWEGAVWGLLVSEVLDVVLIESLLPAPEYPGLGLASCLLGVAGYQDHLAGCLSPGALLSNVEGFEAVDRMVSSWTVPEEALLRERLHRFAYESPDSAKEHIPLAGVRLGTEVFAIDARRVIEFYEPVHTAPVPGCPPHIAGAANVRGDIVTLVDIRPTLRLPVPSARIDLVVLVEDGATVVGIVIDEALTVESVADRQVRAVGEFEARTHRYVSGSLTLDGRRAAVLDLAALLANEPFEINEDA